MTLWAQEMGVPPRIRELARRLADRPGLLVLGPGFLAPGFLDAGLAHSYGRFPRAGVVASDPVDAVVGWEPEPGGELGGTSGPRGSASTLGGAPRWFGVLPYEAARGCERSGRGRPQEERPLPPFPAAQWWRYPAVALVTDRVQVVGDSQGAVRDLVRRLSRSSLPHDTGRSEPSGELETPEAPEIHRARIETALQWIAQGELYQVNLARQFVLRSSASTLALFERLAAAAPGPYQACFDVPGQDCGLATTSPELFLGITPKGRLITAPIKGTRPRGRDEPEDRAAAAALACDSKEAAELAMVVDVERSDLGRVARAGTVRVVTAPKIMHLRTVHHRYAVLEARLRSGKSREDVLRAMLPSGSVTGAPKIRAMELIARLESDRRGLYTGAFGTLQHDGGLVLGMAIRTLVRQRDRCTYFAGGGIVADSDPRREVQETEWKARQLGALLAHGGWAGA